ncbi:STAS domain-containing protein [Streptomyces sp. NPDC046881]|uniref:STAS domain-containing protein n=1 Tax=Streptomyces sp. NPDC046881 TaxID=3155374 RepID=UPI0033C42B21
MPRSAAHGPHLHLDLSGLSLTDVSGLNVLVHLRRCLRAEGCLLAVCGLPPQPHVCCGWRGPTSSSQPTPPPRAAPIRLCVCD